MAQAPAPTFLFAAGLSAFTAACGAGDRSPPAVAVTDSAGVQIVESAAPAWSEDERWRLSSEPVVDIGTVDGPSEYQLFQVRGAVRLDEGRIVIADGGSNELRFYDAEGEFLRAAGGPGSGPGEFGALTGVWRYPGDSIAAFDLTEGRATIFTADGEFARLALLDEGINITFVGPFGTGEFLVQDLMFTTPRTGPELQHVRYHRHASDGTRMDSIGYYPSHVFALRGGPRPEVFGTLVSAAPEGRTWYVSTGSMPEIDLRTADGTLERVIRWEAEERPVTDADIEVYRAGLLEGAETEEAREQVRRRVDETLFASHFPFAGLLTVDREGNLWASRYGYWAERQPVPAGTDAMQWLVFRDDGAWLGAVDVPHGVELLDIGDDYALARVADDFDVEHVVMYELIKPDV